MDNDEPLYSTPEALLYLQVSRRTLDNYRSQGRLTPVFEGTRRLWKKTELDAVKQQWGAKGKPPGRPSGTTADGGIATFTENLLKVTKGKTPPEILAAMELPPNASMRQVTAALQRRIAQLIIEHGAIEVLTAGLYSPDAKTRRETAEALLAKVVPNLKAVETTKTPDPDTAHRQPAGGREHPNEGTFLSASLDVPLLRTPRSYFFCANVPSTKGRSFVRSVGSTTTTAVATSPACTSGTPGCTPSVPKSTSQVPCSSLRTGPLFLTWSWTST